MRSPMTWRITLAFLAASFASSLAADVTTLAWLSGCWELAGDDSGSDEMWTVPAGGALFGIGRTVRSGRTIAHEFMQIRTNDAGRLVFVAKPSNQAESTFELLRRSSDEIVFENLQHDFPQRVMYRREGSGALHARIEGRSNGRDRAIDYRFTRKSCTP